MVQILNQHLCLEDEFCPVAIATNARSWKPLWGATLSWVRIPLPPPGLGTKKPRRPKSAGFLFWPFCQTQTNLWTNLLLAHLI